MKTILILEEHHEISSALKDISHNISGAYIYTTANTMHIEEYISKTAELLICGINCTVDFHTLPAIKTVVFPIDCFDGFANINDSTQFVSCGMHEKDSISLTSSLDDSYNVTVNRELRKLDNSLLGIGEIALHKNECTSDEAFLLAFGGAVCGGLIDIP